MLDYGFANYAVYTPALQENASVSVTLLPTLTVVENVMLPMQRLGHLPDEDGAEPDAASTERIAAA